MSYTSEQLTAISNAIAEGARKVKYADKEVEYFSLDQMRSIRDEMQAELGVAKKTVSRTVAIYSKGL